MWAIIRMISDATFPKATTMYKPLALIRLAEGGYIKVGVNVSLTAKGKKLAAYLNDKE